MDNATQQLIEEFMAYLSKELHERKFFKKVQIIKWHLQNNRLTIDVYLNEQQKKPTQKIYMDIREIKENRHRFSHVLDNLLEQITEKSQEK
jgi:hypothetical protein